MNAHTIQQISESLATDVIFNVVKVITESHLVYREIAELDMPNT